MGLFTDDRELKKKVTLLKVQVEACMELIEESNSRMRDEEESSRELIE